MFSTRAVNASFVQLRHRILPRCCVAHQRSQRQSMSHRRRWVVTPEPSTASSHDDDDDDGERHAIWVVAKCLTCRRKKMSSRSQRADTAAQRVVFQSSARRQNHHRHHQCYPPHQRQHEQHSSRSTRAQMCHVGSGHLRGRGRSTDGIAHNTNSNSRLSLMSLRSRFASTQSAPSRVQRANRLDTCSSASAVNSQHVPRV